MTKPVIRGGSCRSFGSRRLGSSSGEIPCSMDQFQQGSLRKRGKGGRWWRRRKSSPWFRTPRRPNRSTRTRRSSSSFPGDLTSTSPRPRRHRQSPPPAPPLSRRRRRRRRQRRLLKIRPVSISVSAVLPIVAFSADAVLCSRPAVITLTVAPVRTRIIPIGIRW